MFKNSTLICCAAAGSLMLASTASIAGDDDSWEVTITNLTRAQAFTPILVASHKKGVSIFELGSAASDELAALAEGGDVKPLTAVLEANNKVKDVKNSGGLLMPGASVTVTVSSMSGAKRITVASMLIPTNDTFIALMDVKAPRHGSNTYYSPGYDAGSEPNDELCANIPGPVCMGTGGSPGVGGEGYVHISGGINGIGDLLPETYSWHNPVAKITIRRAEENSDSDD